jgi:hypothetical protein
MITFEVKHILNIRGVIQAEVKVVFYLKPLQLPYDEKSNKQGKPSEGRAPLTSLAIHNLLTGSELCVILIQSHSPSNVT